jgi:hypothetical protein
MMGKKVYKHLNIRAKDEFLARVKLLSAVRGVSQAAFIHGLVDQAWEEYTEEVDRQKAQSRVGVVEV